MKFEDEINEKIEKCDNLSQVNIPLSEEFITNNRGQKLHVRTSIPDSPKAVVIFIHGYASHINRPSHLYFMKSFNSKSIGYIGMDFHGHGHSEGTKALLSHENDVVDDLLSLLLCVYSTDAMGNGYKFKKTLSHSVDFFLIGHSMGGAISLLAGNLLTHLNEDTANTPFSLTIRERLKPIVERFKGTLLYCPAITVPKIPSVLVLLLDYIIVPMFPETTLPFHLGVGADLYNIWKDDRFIRYIQHDSFPRNPDGLSWGDPMRFVTASKMNCLIGRAAALVSSVDYPFVVFHDPVDAICTIEGSQTLMKTSLTREEDKQLILVEDGRHDIVSNCTQFLIEHSVSWVEKRIAKSA